MRLYECVFALAERLDGQRLPRAVVPRIGRVALQGPKIRRKLITEWFAQRVEEQHQRCVARAAWRAQSRARVRAAPVASERTEGRRERLIEMARLPGKATEEWAPLICNAACPVSRG
jgi:hypothetical protein